MKIIACWESGAFLPVIIQPSDRVSELQMMIQFSTPLNHEMLMIHEDRVLNGDELVESCGMKDGDIVTVVFKQKLKKLFTDTDLFKKKCTNGEWELFGSITKEQLRLEDLRDLRKHRVGSYISESGDENDNTDDFSSFVIPLKSNSISTDPLPVFWMTNEVEDEEVPQMHFKTIREVAMYYQHHEYQSNFVF